MMEASEASPPSSEDRDSGSEVQTRRGRSRGRPRGRSRGARASATSASGSSVRGRGRGVRASSRGRGVRASGRGRGAQASGISAVDLARMETMASATWEEIRTATNQLTVPQMRQFIELVVSRQLGCLQDIMMMINDNVPPPVGPPPNAPHWCVCGNCREMPTLLESACCDMQPQNCMSQSAIVRLVITNPHVLSIHNGLHREIYRGPGDNDGDNRALRHGSYRQYTLYRHGQLGNRVRRVIPSCVVWLIRDTYPSRSGMYTGFIPS